MQEIYEKTFTLGSTDVDAYGLCRPAMLLSLFQDLATEHSINLHISREYLLENYNAVWMLVRVWYRLRRPIRTGERLTVQTWYRCAGGVIVYRDFDLYVDGEPVGEAVAAWVVADIDNHKMLRPGSVENIAALPAPGKTKDKQLKLIHTPKHRRVSYTKTIRYSDVDINGHMNNTRYADVLMDALTVEEMRGRFVSELQLNYSMECRFGESIDISRAAVEEGCYIDGCSDDGTRRFEAILQFRPCDETELDENTVCE